VRLWRLLYRLKPEMTEFSTPKAGLLGSIAAMLCGVPARVYFLRGLKLETCTGVKRRILLVAERLAAACSHVVLCNSDSLRNQALPWVLRPRPGCACWAAEAATELMWSASTPVRAVCERGSVFRQMCL